MRRPLTSSFQGQTDQSNIGSQGEGDRNCKFYDTTTPTGLNFEVKVAKVMGI